MVQLVFTIWKFILVVILTNSQNIQETKSLEFLVSLRDNMKVKTKINSWSLLWLVIIHMIFLHASITKISLVSRKICKGLRWPATRLKAVCIGRVRTISDISDKRLSLYWICFAIRPNSASNHTLLTPRYGQYPTHANNHITLAVSAIDSNLVPRGCDSINQHPQGTL